MLITTPCPRNVIIDLDTAYLKVFKTDSAPALDSRCISCNAKVQANRIFKQLGLLAGDGNGDENDNCSYQLCVKQRWLGTKYCEMHAIASATVKSTPDMKTLDSIENTLSQASLRQWEYDQPFEKVLSLKRQVAEGQIPGSRLLCLDLEFSPSSKKIFEVGLLELCSGKVLSDSRIKHSSDLHESPRDSKYGSYSTHPIAKGISNMSASKIYGQGTKSIASTNHLDIHEVAAQFCEKGVTPESIILTWHTGAYDLLLLQIAFNEAGHVDILPPLENCIPMIPLFRKNLPKSDNGKNFPLSLEVIFPIMYKGHELVGRNHRAIVDALQLRLMVMAFEQNCKPPDEMKQIRLRPTSLERWLAQSNQHR
jgi:hypothetical protein